MTAIPRLVIAAPSSGHGKTAVAVGLLAAFAGRGLSTVGFKIGADYVDAGYLGLASGQPGRNLDPRLVGSSLVPGLFGHGACGSDVAVIEGTMGLYDSLSGGSDGYSTAQVSGLLRTPVVMVVDASAIGQSVAALVHGFRAFDDLLWLAGVVLNRVVSDRHERVLREALEGIGVPVLGVLRSAALGSLPTRAQGLVPVMDRSAEAVRSIRRLGEAVASSLELDRLLTVARTAPTLPDPPWCARDAVGEVALGQEPPLVAVAGGPTFSYGYSETVELLEAAGARVAFFDPLREEQLPERTRAVVIGGGFPETYADEVGANAPLCRQIAELAREGRPILAESGGVLWLVSELDGRPMSGVLDVAARSGSQLVLGYREATARASSPLVKLGATVVGHESRRSVVTPRAGNNAAWQCKGGPPEGFVWRGVHASYLNLHWAGYPEIARRFVEAAG